MKTSTEKIIEKTRRQSSRTCAYHPLRELLQQLHTANTNRDQNQTASISMNNHPLIENTEMVTAVCQNGIAALGHLLAHSSPLIEDGTVGADSVEALGWLIAELGDLTAYCLVLASELRRDPSCAGLSKVA